MSLVSEWRSAAAAAALLPPRNFLVLKTHGQQKIGTVSDQLEVYLFFNEAILILFLLLHDFFLPKD